MESSEVALDTPIQTSKAKRVRTGCLTCRNRHLKCDEHKPVCHNCIKSNRECKKGIKLNFVDMTVRAPPVELPPAANWQVAFVDESRNIAGEYKGGLANYPLVKYEYEPRNPVGPPSGHAQQTHIHMNMQSDIQNNMQSLTPPLHQPPPLIAPDAYPQETLDPTYEQQYHQGPSHHHHSSLHHESTDPTIHMAAVASQRAPAPDTPQSEGVREYLNTKEEVLYMQVFVEEVGLWMDSMDPQKHFSRLLPFHSLGEPMLLNAFLACGARHLTLVNTKYTEEKALYYYNTATHHLLESLQNPDRNTVICATTAVILNVYEIMSERALQRMNHIAGARALIKECGWNATSTGIGAACFWVNVGMEVLSCLHFNWQVAWDPDEWGVDMNLSRDVESGREDIWCHRIVYIVAKVANFRATMPKANATPETEQRRQAEWERLKNMADTWDLNIPRTMHPIAYLEPGFTLSGSAFPEVWLIKRVSTVARLFYHTAMCLLSQINPQLGREEHRMMSLQRRHSRYICGISAHVKDRGVASVALRSLAIAAECLTDRREQEEVLQIFDKIQQETGWRVAFVNNELKAKWSVGMAL